MRVEEWFAGLDRAARKDVLVALHCCRDIAEGNVPTHHAVRSLRAVWPRLRPLLAALDDDHYQLKLDEGDTNAGDGER